MVPVVLFAFWILFAHTQVDGLETYEINVDKLICMVNFERAKIKLPPLGRNKNLHGAAKEQAEYQAKMHRMQHEGEGNCNVGARADRHNYRWNKIAENVAFGFDKPDVVMFQWMCSKGHRKNIEDPNLTEMNIAATKSDKNVVYWAQVFGQIKDKKPDSMCDCKPFANEIVTLREYEKANDCPGGAKVDPGPDDNPFLKGGTAAKPAEAKPTEAKPAEAKPAPATKPAEAKPAPVKEPAHKHHHHQQHHHHHQHAPAAKPVPAANKAPAAVTEQPKRQRGGRGRGRRNRDRNGNRDRDEGRDGDRRKLR